MLSSQIMTLGSSINDVTLFLTIFDTPLTLFSKRLRYKIIDPFPLNPWRHLSSRIDIREFFFNSVTGKSFTIDLVESMNALKMHFSNVLMKRGQKKWRRKKIVEGSLLLILLQPNEFIISSCVCIQCEKLFFFTKKKNEIERWEDDLILRTFNLL